MINTTAKLLILSILFFSL